MVDDPQAQLVERVLAERLRQMQHVTSLPIVFGGAVRRSAGRPELCISQLRGAIGNSLAGLRVGRGQGLGGTALVRGTPCRVNDYVAARAITHDFDRHVVHDEKITSVFAVPIRVRGAVGGIIYGAVRAAQPIGDVALQRAGAFVGSIEREIQSFTAAPRTLTGPYTSGQVRTALDELAEIASTTADTALRTRLKRIVDNLVGAAAVSATWVDETGAGAAERPAVHLAPRELELLRFIAVGMSNRDAAEAMGLSPETIKAYLRSAMRRLEVGNRTAAVHAARSLGLL